MLEQGAKRILYIEDDKASAELLKEYLEESDFDYKVDLAFDGKKGIDKYKKDKHHIVIVDYNIPGMNGLEIIKALTNEDIFPPIIMLTHLGSEKIAVESMKYGAYDYVAKDVEGKYLQLLPTVIEQALIKKFMENQTKSAEERLQESETRFRRLSEASFEGVIIHEKGKIIDSNNTFAEMIQINYQDILNKNIIDVLKPENPDNFRKKILSEYEKPFEVVSMKNGSDKLYLEVRTRSVPFEGRTVSVAAIRDITERKKSEEELRSQKQHLERLNQIKNELLGMAAHDMRNPLGVIYTYANFLLEDSEKLSSQQQKFLTRIFDTSNFMMSLINDILDISNIESGEVNIQSTKQNYVEFVDNNIELNRILADKKDITLEFKSDKKDYQVNFDKNKIEQVLNNLVSNAIKFSNPGTKTVVEVKKDGDFILTNVTDQGLGIPENELELVFKPFSKTSVKSTGGEKSTGLGLAIVKRIIEAHKGEIGVMSKVGEGSTFYFTLPRIK